MKVILLALGLAGLGESIRQHKFLGISNAGEKCHDSDDCHGWFIRCWRVEHRGRRVETCMNRFSCEGTVLSSSLSDEEGGGFW